MLSDEDSSPEEAIEIAIKKNLQEYPINEKKKIVKPKTKVRSKPVLPSHIQNLLQDKI